MATMTISEEQLVELVERLPTSVQDAVFRALLAKRWPSWFRLAGSGEDRLRAAAAQRGCDWDRMTDDEREAFINEIVHEDRACSR